MISISGSRWRVKDLTYKISRYPSTKRLSKRDVDNEIKKALNVWSKHTDLNFIQKRSGKVHIDVRFEEGEHGDGDPFDGSGGTLAHAFFPVFGGDAHFDDDEPWTINSYRGNYDETKLGNQDPNPFLYQNYYGLIFDLYHLNRDQLASNCGP